jgi:hypothetical protein
VIPFAVALAEAIPPVAVRLRRDFKMLLRLVQTHALLHRASRDRDERGRVVARAEDYLAVRALVADLLSEGVGTTVATTIRETVDAVRKLASSEGVTVRTVAAALSLDRSAAQRRPHRARELGYVVNLESRNGKRARYIIGDALPGEHDLLPVTLSPAKALPSHPRPIRPVPPSRSASPADEARAIARDARGATTTARKEVSCAQCEGTAVPCTSFHGNPSLCNAQPGCSATFIPPSTWVCTGSRTCDGMDQPDCTATFGCGWVTY